MADDDVTARVVEHEAGGMVIRLQDRSAALANQLRWAMGRDLPTDAISEVTVLENTTPFPDELIAHRLGLIPLRKLKDAPTASEPRTVELFATSGEHSRRVFASELRGAYAAVDDDLIVATLPPQCSLKLRAAVSTGLGRTHQRFNHVAACRIDQRTRGMDAHVPECWCCSAERGRLCLECNGWKAPKDLVGAPIDYLLAFEAIGERDPLEMVHDSLIATYMKLSRVKSQLSSSAVVDKKAYV